MLTVLTQGPPFLSGNGFEDLANAIRIGQTIPAPVAARPRQTPTIEPCRPRRIWLNRRADTALARRGDSSSRRRSRKPSRGMDSAGKIPQGRAPWPSIALAWRSHSLKRPAGSSRTMHRHRHRCWSRTFRPTRVREERSFALVASLGKRSSPLPHQYIPSGIGCLNHQSPGAKEDATAATGSPDATRDPR
jgi:hypothetical protein